MKLWLVVAVLVALVLGGVVFFALSKSKPTTEPEPADETGAWFADVTERLGVDFVHEAGDHKALTFFEFDVGLHAACGESRDSESRKRHGVGKIDRRYFRLDVHLDGAVGSDGGIEIQANTILTELDSDSPGVTAALQNRYRELTTSEEAGFFAVEGSQVWFGEDLQDVLVLKGTYGSTEIQVGAKCKYIQGIRNIEHGRDIAPRCACATNGLKPGLGILIGGNTHQLY